MITPPLSALSEECIADPARGQPNFLNAMSIDVMSPLTDPAPASSVCWLLWQSMTGE